MKQGKEADNKADFCYGISDENISTFITYLMDNSGKLVLGYWPIRGLAERIRLVLEYTGLQYEQVFYY